MRLILFCCLTWFGLTDEVEKSLVSEALWGSIDVLTYVFGGDPRFIDSINPVSHTHICCVNSSIGVRNNEF